MTDFENASLAFTENHNLRSGTYPWRDGPPTNLASDILPAHLTDVSIIGAGIMGAILAERLSATGRSVAILDRRAPCEGSTRASTAQVMWAMDVPLIYYAKRAGRDAAGRCWKRVYDAVRNLEHRITGLGIECNLAERSTLYLDGNILSEGDLMQEAALRRQFDLPSQFLNAAEVEERFGISPRSAILASGDFEIDPVRLCEGLLCQAQACGAKLIFPADVRSVRPLGPNIQLMLDDGTAFRTRAVVIATGYERASALLPPEFRLGSTFAIATAPETAPLWKENAMIWEAADPYLYVRTDASGRIIAGGEDIDSADPAVRDAVRQEKAGIIAAKLERLLDQAPISIQRSWAATFGYSPDGLPAIGRSALMQNVWIAAGFGGNGIAFAGLASELIEGGLSGCEDPSAALFDPYRFQLSART